MEKYLSDPLWLLGAFGWIVGVISGFLQVKSYLDQKKYENAHKIILEQAERDWKGKYTQEQIDSMVKEIRLLEASINQDIPRKARRVFLEDQLSTLKDDLAQNYSRYNELVTELGNVEEKLPDQIQHTIETTIMPSYLANKRESKQLYWLLVAAISLIVVLNWDFFARLIPLEWKVGDYRSGFYPLNWLIIYFSFSVILSLVIHQTIAGIWIKKFITSLFKHVSDKPENKSLRTTIKTRLQFGFSFIVFVLAISLSISSPMIYMALTENKVMPSYGDGFGSDFVAMPLSNVPMTIFYAIPPATLLFLFFDFFTRVKRRNISGMSSDK